MTQEKSYSTPMATGSPLSIHDNNPFDYPHLYRQVVGTLQYATITLPDIAFVVNKVSQFMHAGEDAGFWSGGNYRIIMVYRVQTH
jgi:hypothetical protein